MHQVVSNENIFNINKYIIEILRELPQTQEINYKIGEILEMSRIGFEINSLNIPFTVRIDINYYLYENEKHKYISLISPNEWNNTDIFIGCFKLNENYIWIKV